MVKRPWVPAAEYDFTTKKLTAIELVPGQDLTGRNLVFADVPTSVRESHPKWTEALFKRIRTRVDYIQEIRRPYVGRQG